MGTLTVRVPLTPARALSPNARVHWRVLRRAQGEAREAAKYSTINTIVSSLDADQTIPQSRRLLQAHGTLRLSYVVAWGKRRQRMDADNLIASLKAYQDGVADALLINDRHFIVGDVQQIRDKEGLGYVEITVSLSEERRSA